MYTEIMIARSEHQLMQSEVAQQSQRDDVIVEDAANAREGLRARMRRLFTRASGTEAPRQPASRRVQGTRTAA